MRCRGVTRGGNEIGKKQDKPRVLHIPNTCKKQDKLQLLNARSAISTEEVVNECLIHLPLMLLLLLLQLLLLLLLLLVTLTAKKGSSVYILPLSSPSVSPS